MSKQTAVEFYRTELSTLVSMKESKFQNENEIFEQAKQMEKEQMIDAWVNGCDNGYDKACDNITWEEMDSAKDNYYNETYGGTQC
jgi:hypothetical protein